MLFKINLRLAMVAAMALGGEVTMELVAVVLEKAVAVRKAVMAVVKAAEEAVMTVVME